MVSRDVPGNRMHVVRRGRALPCPVAAGRPSPAPALGLSVGPMGYVRPTGSVLPFQQSVDSEY